MNESDLHARIYARSADLAGAFPGVVVGPGDDCAVVRTQGGDQLLLKVDQLVEHRHFTSKTPVDLIARKAIGRAVSDIAAMGGTTVGGWGLASGVLPPGYPHGDELCARLAHWGRHWGVPLVGGDIATGPAGCPLSLSVTVVGVPHLRRGPVLRSTARPGDEVWVTGRIGGSLGVDGMGRHLTFEPRLGEARWLCDVLASDLHAMIDVSDGLGRDAGRLAGASGVRVILDAASVPLAEGLADVAKAVADGEDYELLFCAAPGVMDGASRLTSLVVMTRIGRVECGSGAVLVTEHGELDAANLGWDH